jgi:hypothetical protein
MEVIVSGNQGDGLCSIALSVDFTYSISIREFTSVSQ